MAHVTCRTMFGASVKLGDPQVTMGFNTKSCSNDLDDLGYLHFGKTSLFVHLAMNEYLLIRFLEGYSHP